VNQNQSDIRYLNDLRFSGFKIWICESTDSEDEIKIDTRRLLGDSG
jgi:hypothetical protein